MAARTQLTRNGAVRIGLVAVAALVVAEGAVWLMRPNAEAIQPTPVSEHSYFSEKQLRKARDFREPQRLIGLGALASEGAALALLALWRPRPLRQALRAAEARPLLGGAAVGAGIAVVVVLAGLPLGAVAQERARDVGLSTQTLGSWLADQGRAAGIAAALAAAAGVAAVALLRRLGDRFWIAGAALVVATAAVFSWLAPVVLAPVFNRFEPLPRGPLRSEVLGLGRRAGVQIGQVYRVDASRRSTAINAYVDGLGPTKRVVLYDNAIRELAPGELESVIAHELSHVKGNDVLRGLAFVALVAPLGMLFAQLLGRSLARRSGDAPHGPAALPALGFAVALAAFALAIPGNQLSRDIEARADTFALELTGRPSTFIEMQRALVTSSLADPDPPRALQLLFGTHPTTMERIGAAVAIRSRETRAGS